MKKEKDKVEELYFTLLRYMKTFWDYEDEIKTLADQRIVDVIMSVRSIYEFCPEYIEQDITIRRGIYLHNCYVDSLFNDVVFEPDREGESRILKYADVISLGRIYRILSLAEGFNACMHIKDDGKLTISRCHSEHRLQLIDMRECGVYDTNCEAKFGVFVYYLGGDVRLDHYYPSMIDIHGGIVTIYTRPGLNHAFTDDFEKPLDSLMGEDINRLWDNLMLNIIDHTHNMGTLVIFRIGVSDRDRVVEYMKKVLSIFSELRCLILIK